MLPVSQFSSNLELPSHIWLLIILDRWQDSTINRNRGLEERLTTSFSSSLHKLIFLVLSYRIRVEKQFQSSSLSSSLSLCDEDGFRLEFRIWELILSMIAFFNTVTWLFYNYQLLIENSKGEETIIS